MYTKRESFFKILMQNASGVTGDIEDDIDAKRRRLYESRGSGDDIDPPRGQRIYPPAPAPVEFTLVPCHNDMLIMFASPQGQFYWYIFWLNIFDYNCTLIVTFHSFKKSKTPTVLKTGFRKEN